MIFEILQVITEEVNGYIDGSPITLENIATIDDDSDNQSDTNGVILTLLNMQEEYALKNISNNYKNGNDVEYKNPKVNLNLYILFSAKKSTYIESLKSLSKVVEFFQGKRIFTQSNTNFKREGDMINVKNFRFIVDLFTPTFEEQNFIWGTLGGKQFPSVMYKVTSIEIERDLLLSKGTLISGINTNAKNN